MLECSGKAKVKSLKKKIGTKNKGNKWKLLEIINV